jgi:putative glutamine amidotransferase
MPQRPLIGVTKPDRGDMAAFWAARLALALAGARSRALTAEAPGETLALDGLMLGGGSDVHPSLFRAAPKVRYPYDLKREAMELTWLRRAWAEDLPTLGVCRGAQLMNVAAGGALHLNMAETFPGTRYPSHWLEQIHFRKRIILEPGSRLAAIVGRDELRVNSIHSQAASHLGEGLTVCARETNGAIQAIEAPARRFWLGVQFHPEFLIYRRRYRRIFQAFVAAAAGFASARRPPPQPDLNDDARRRRIVDLGPR